MPLPETVTDTMAAMEPARRVSNDVPGAATINETIGGFAYNEKLPEQDRVHYFLQDKAAQGKTFDEIKPAFKETFGADADPQKNAYDSMREHAYYADKTPDLVDYATLRSIPFYSAVGTFGMEIDYHDARKRTAEGNPREGNRPHGGLGHDSDAKIIARYERLQELEAKQNETTGGATRSALAHIPAIIGEAWLTGGIANAAKGSIYGARLAASSPKIAKMLGIAGKGAPAAGEAAAETPSLLGIAGLRNIGTREGAKTLAKQGAVEIPKKLVNNAAQTAAMPSMYLPQSAQAANAEGGEWNDHIARSYALGNLQNLVLGRLSSKADFIPGKNLGTAGLRLGTRTGAGMVEQQGIDAFAGTIGLQTRYGLIQDLADGKEGEFQKNITVQALTFAAFSASHSHVYPRKYMEAHAAMQDANAAAGMTPKESALESGRVVTHLEKMMADQPGTTADEARKQIPADWTDPQKAFAELHIEGTFPKGKMPRPSAGTGGGRLIPPEGTPPASESRNSYPAELAARAEKTLGADWKREAEGLKFGPDELKSYLDQIELGSTPISEPPSRKVETAPPLPKAETAPVEKPAAPESGVPTFGEGKRVESLVGKPDAYLHEIRDAGGKRIGEVQLHVHESPKYPGAKEVVVENITPNDAATTTAKDPAAVGRLGLKHARQFAGKNLDAMVKREAERHYPDADLVFTQRSGKESVYGEKETWTKKGLQHKAEFERIAAEKAAAKKKETLTSILSMSGLLRPKPPEPPPEATDPLSRKVETGTPPTQKRIPLGLIPRPAAKPPAEPVRAPSPQSAPEAVRSPVRPAAAKPEPQRPMSGMEKDRMEHEAAVARLQGRRKSPSAKSEPNSSGELDRAFADAGLTAREEHVLRERAISGRTQPDISRDSVMLKEDGTPMTREGIRKIEAKALGKLKADGSVKKLIHDKDAARAKADDTAKARGATVLPDDLRFDPADTPQRHEQKLTATESAQKKVEDLADLLLEGKMTNEQVNAELARLAGEGTPEVKRTGKRKAAGRSEVRSERTPPTPEAALRAGEAAADVAAEPQRSEPSPRPTAEVPGDRPAEVKPPSGPTDAELSAQERELGMPPLDGLPRAERIEAIRQEKESAAAHEAEIAQLRAANAVQKAAAAAKAKGMKPKQGPEALVRSLVGEWKRAAEGGKPEAAEHLATAIWNLDGVRQIGEANESVAFDPAEHAGEGLAKGDRVVIDRPGWAFGRDGKETAIEKALSRKVEAGTDPDNTKPGRKTTVRTADGAKYDARYELREVRDAKASHVVRGNGLDKTADYPSGLQPRDKTKRAAFDAVDTMARDLDPDVLLSNDPNAAAGPPTLSSDGFALNGNTRQNAMEHAVALGKYGPIREAVIKRAAEFGLDPKRAAAMHNPAVYRVTDMKADSPEAAKFAREGNVSVTKAQSSVREAASLAALVDSDILRTLHVEPDSTFSEAISGRGGDDFRAALFKELPATARDAYFTNEGNLTAAGKDLVQNMLLLKSGFPVETIEKMGEDLKGVKRTIEGSIPQLVKLKREFPTNDPMPAMVEALDGWMSSASNMKIRSAGDVAKQMDQLSFDGSSLELSPGGRMMLEFLLANGTKPRVFREKLEAAIRGEEYARPNLLSEFEPKKAQTPGERFAANLGVKYRPGSSLGNTKQGNLPPQASTAESLKSPRGFAPLSGGGDPSTVTPYAIKATIDAKLGVKTYPGNLPTGSRMQSEYLTKQQAATIGSLQAGDAQVHVHEAGHDIAIKNKFESDPAKLPPDVVRGFKELDYDKLRPANAISMQEGFAEFVRRRSVDDLGNLSPDERAAATYAETFLKAKGLVGKLDAVRDMFRGYKAQNPTQQARGLVSRTGQPAKPQLSPKEAVADLFQRTANDIQDGWTNDLGVVERMDKLREKIRGAKLAPGESLYVKFAALRNAAKTFAGEWARDGQKTMVDGKMTVVGLSDAAILGEHPEWAERGGVYATMKHALTNEVRAGAKPSEYKSLVAPDQLKLYGDHVKAEEADPAFGPWSKGFHERLSKGGYLSQLKAMEAKEIHLLEPGTAAHLDQQHPDYVRFSRVQEPSMSTKGGGVGSANITRKRSGESGAAVENAWLGYVKRREVVAALFESQMKKIALEEAAASDPGGLGKYLLVAEPSAPNEAGAKEIKRVSDELQKLGVTGVDAAQIVRDLGLTHGVDYFDAAPWPAHGEASIPYYGKGGKLTTIRIGDRALYDLVTNQMVESRWIASTFRMLSKFPPFRIMNDVVKFGAVTASATFQVYNAPRDAHTFFGNTVDRLSTGNLFGAMRDTYAWHFRELLGHFGGKQSTDRWFQDFVDRGGRQLRKHSFDPSNPTKVYGEQSSGIPKAVKSGYEALKDAIGFLGAGELGPRYLEYQNRLKQVTGKTKEQIVAELKAADAMGPNRQDPIAFWHAAEAMNAAAEVTTPFSRIGTNAREINKITPFFGPAIAGLSKQLRNAKTNPKGAAMAVGITLSLRMLHWLLFSDEDWYKDLEPHAKYEGFVVSIGGKRFVLPAPRGLDVPIGGMLTLALDAAYKKNPDVKGLVKSSLDSMAPPAPVPPAGKVAWELQGNEGWTGKPVVPGRDEHLPATEKAAKYQAPYAIDQLTGGIGKERRVGEFADFLPLRQDHSHRSVTDFYAKMKELESERLSAKRSGLVYKNESEYDRMSKSERKMLELNRELRGEKMVSGKVVKTAPPSKEREAAIRAEQVKVARAAMGR